MNLHKYQQMQKRRTLKMLDELSKRIQREELVVTDFGFWPSSISKHITFRITVLSRDDEKELHDFEQI